MVRGRTSPRRLAAWRITPALLLDAAQVLRRIDVDRRHGVTWSGELCERIGRPRFDAVSDCRPVGSRRGHCSDCVHSLPLASRRKLSPPTDGHPDRSAASGKAQANDRLTEPSSGAHRVLGALHRLDMLSLPRARAAHRAVPDDGERSIRTAAAQLLLVLSRGRSVPTCRSSHLEPFPPWRIRRIAVPPMGPRERKRVRPGGWVTPAAGPRFRPPVDRTSGTRTGGDRVLLDREAGRGGVQAGTDDVSE